MLLRRWQCLVLWREDIHGPTHYQHPKWSGVCCSKQEIVRCKSSSVVKGRKHFNESVMASVAVSRAASKDISSFCRAERTKVDAGYYRETLLQRCLYPEVCQKSDDQLVFQQDGATSHRPKSVTGAYSAELHWIACNSPDLNPVDYAVWGGALLQSVYRIPNSNLDDLKDRMRTCWENLDQQIIDKSIDHWRDRLKAVVRVTLDTLNSCFDYLVHLLSCSVV